MSSDKDKNNNGWNEWSNKVLSDLREFKDDIKEIYEMISDLKVEIAIIKAKAAIISGVVGTVIVPIIYIIVKMFFGG